MLNEALPLSLEDESTFESDQVLLNSTHVAFDNAHDICDIVESDSDFTEDSKYLNLGEIDGSFELSNPFLRFDKHLSNIKSNTVSLLVDTSILCAQNLSKAKKVKYNRRKQCEGSDVKKVENLSNLEMAELFEEDNKFLTIDKILNIYDKKFGLFIPFDSESTDLMIRRQAPPEIRNRLTSYIIREIVLWLKSKTNWEAIDGERLKRLNSNYLNFRNCTLELPTLQVYAHSPDFFCTSVLNVEYDERFVDYRGSLFFKVLTDLIGDDPRKIDLLQEIFSVIIASIQLKYFYFLCGVPDSGKSKIADVLRYIMGSEYTSAISLKRFDGQFGLGGLRRKRLNIAVESNEITRAGIEIIKQLTGGDYCLGERKYEHAFEFFPQAVLVFISNHKLRVLDGQADQAFLNRMCILEFINSIPPDRQDNELASKLKSPTEINAIISWTLEGVQRLYRNNFRLTQIANPVDYITQDVIEESKNQREVITNLFSRYLEEYFNINPKDKIQYVSVSDIFDGFREYIGTDEDFEYRESKWLHDTLQDSFNLEKRRVKPTGQLMQIYVYYGLSSKDESLSKKMEAIDNV